MKKIIDDSRMVRLCVTASAVWVFVTILQIVSCLWVGR